MSKDSRPLKGVSKSNVTASATAAAATRKQTSAQQPRLDASASSSIPGIVSVTTPAVSARYIDSRLKQFCLR